jgi:hypothetical protein
LGEQINDEKDHNANTKTRTVTMFRPIKNKKSTIFNKQSNSKEDEKNPFQDQPEEIILLILSFLNSRDLVSVAQVDKQFNILSNDKCLKLFEKKNSFQLPDKIRLARISVPFAKAQDGIWYCHYVDLTLQKTRSNVFPYEIWINFPLPHKVDKKHYFDCFLSGRVKLRKGEAAQLMTLAKKDHKALIDGIASLDSLSSRSAILHKRDDAGWTSVPGADKGLDLITILRKDLEMEEGLYQKAGRRCIIS